MSDFFHRKCMQELLRGGSHDHDLKTAYIILERVANTRGGYLTELYMLFHALYVAHFSAKQDANAHDVATLIANDHDVKDALNKFFLPNLLCGKCQNCFRLSLIWLVELAQQPKERQATTGLIQALHRACCDEKIKNLTACHVSWRPMTSLCFECVFPPPSIRLHSPPPLPHECKASSQPNTVPAVVSKPPILPHERKELMLSPSQLDECGRQSSKSENGIQDVYNGPPPPLLPHERKGMQPDVYYSLCTCCTPSKYRGAH
jgi:hypothetical protein